LLLNEKYDSPYIPTYLESQDLYKQSDTFAKSLESTPILNYDLISNGAVNKRVNGNDGKFHLHNLETNKKRYGQKKTFFGNRPVKNTFLTHYYGRLIKY
jgi:hypothetical protein